MDGWTKEPKKNNCHWKVAFLFIFGPIQQWKTGCWVQQRSTNDVDECLLLSAVRKKHKVQNKFEIICCTLFFVQYSVYNLQLCRVRKVCKIWSDKNSKFHSNSSLLGSVAQDLWCMTSELLALSIVYLLPGSPIISQVTANIQAGNHFAWVISFVIRYSQIVSLSWGWQGVDSQLFSYSFTQWNNNWKWNVDYLIHLKILIFDNRFSNQAVTFLLSAAEPLQWRSLWSRGDVSLVIVNLFLLFLLAVVRGAGERVLRLWEALPFPLIGPCGTCMNTAASTRKSSAKWNRYSYF